MSSASFDLNQSGRLLARAREGLLGAIPAAILSGIPSTTHALLTRKDVLESTEAAGTLLLRNSRSRAQLVPAGAVAHLGISALWGVVLGVALPRKNAVAWGMAAGAAIAAVDLGIIGRRYERLRALALGPQVADHLAFGAIVGYQLQRQAARQAS